VKEQENEALTEKPTIPTRIQMKAQQAQMQREILQSDIPAYRKALMWMGTVDID
jgi:hypothetical protein